MDLGEGLISVFGVGDEGVMAFTDFGIEDSRELIHKEYPNSLSGEIGDPLSRLSADEYASRASCLARGRLRAHRRTPANPSHELLP
ncbi:hypothetical protein [Bradyrhizobium sp. SSUT77]|uniref:hypothetical protein n=1 Tax=Bradyrhizobium sp. SSUT77 TaxID=3040603 RepID=UPI00244A3C9A|nr:hypothetical protein [Bradyrhizobium sp. SSUT77]MDH2347753.1 hypothetical protein [Bradyrhizobium sp. SSUT77]